MFNIIFITKPSSVNVMRPLYSTLQVLHVQVLHATMEEVVGMLVIHLNADVLLDL